jgi:hypothetical protein
MPARFSDNCIGELAQMRPLVGDGLGKVNDFVAHAGEGPGSADALISAP